MNEEGGRAPLPWLFGARVDLAVFGGSALLSLLLLALGSALGILHQDTPEWAWVPAVLIVDVAHVWSTMFRVYWDRQELERRFGLYVGLPIVIYVLAVVVYSFGPSVFWRFAAYLAVFHFVRQQYGWVMLYRRRAKDRSVWDRRLDTATIYAATLYPLLYWHAHLPRGYWWFVPGDFSLRISQSVVAFVQPLYWALLAGYAMRSLHRYLREGYRNPGKDLVVFTTALMWHLGIITFDSDYAFTVTNVLIHGIPYFALIYWYGHRQLERGHTGLIRTLAKGPFVFVLILVLLAYGEELFWDKLFWQEREYLFGGGLTLGESLELFILPLLALPQLVHYCLDGFIWKSSRNPHSVPV